MTEAILADTRGERMPVRVASERNAKTLDLGNLHRNAVTV